MKQHSVATGFSCAKVIHMISHCFKILLPAVENCKDLDLTL